MTTFLIMSMAKLYLVRVFILLLMIMLMLVFVIMFVNVLLIMSMSAFSLFVIMMIVLICYRSCDIFLKRTLSFFNLSILDYNFYLMLMDLLTLSLFFVAMLFILIIDQALNIFAYYL